MAQEAPTPKAEEPALSASQNEIGGKVSFESIVILEGKPSASLRYGSVKRGSESVELNGRKLQRGVGYAIDYASGTIYLMVEAPVGATLRVNYRYEESTGKAGTFNPMGEENSAASFTGFTFNLVRGANAFVGLGMTERLGDGTVLNSNIYGLTNSFSFAGDGKISGLFMMSDRQKSNSASLIETGGPGAEVEEGQGRAMIQSLSSSILGGRINAYYQDIDTRFAGFGSFTSAGYTQEQVNQLQKEKGLERTSLAVQDVGTGDLKLSHSQSMVGDGDGNQITQSANGFKLGQLSYSQVTQKVGQNFNRFQDLGAADWQWLQKERGLTRQSTAAAFAFNGGAFAYNSFETGEDSTSVRRRALSFNSNSLQLEMFEQEVDSDFKRFGDLRPDDWNNKSLLGAQFQNFGNERGLTRKGFSATSKLIPGTEFSYRANSVKDDKGDIDVMTALLNRGPLSIQHTRIGIDSNFNRVGNLGADINAFADMGVKMLNPAQGLHGNDPAAFINGAGIDRSLWRLDYILGKDSKLGYQVQNIQGQKDELRSSRFFFNSAKVNIAYSDQKTGEDFSEISRLMQSERGVYGNTAGLDKKDFSIQYKASDTRNIEVSSMNADGLKGGASRSNFLFNDKNLNFRYTRRSVDSEFGGVHDLVDPERDLLRSIIGQDMTEMSLRWQLLPNLGIESNKISYTNSTLDQTGGLEQLVAKWAPSKRTNVEYFRWGQAKKSPLEDLIDQYQERLTLHHDFGRLGRLMLSQHNRTFSGSLDEQLDSQTQAMAFETQLSKNTAFRTEHTETTFENGEKETIMANTLSADLTSKVGVSVTDLQIKRDGENPNEARRQYGFWWDFGKGLKVKYGYARSLKDEANGTLNSNTELSAGEFQGVKVNSATYRQERIDDTRDQHFGGLSIANARPLQWGFLNDVRFHYNSDTHRDYDVWKREKKSFGFGATSGNVAFGYDYQSQIDVNQERAIDRFFTLGFDKTGKAPLQVNLRYGLRTMPNDQNVMIRDYTVSYKPSDKVSFEHSVKTNLLKDQNNMILGSVATPERSNIWAMNYTANPGWQAGLYWKESLNDQANILRREAGVDLLLFRNNPSPLRLQYGLEQNEQNGKRLTAHRWGIIFNQRPGPNQSLNFMLENRSWEHQRGPDLDLQKWNMRLDFSVRF